ncbi:MAG: hypothetical protein FWG92_06405 [Leptospirales bacterium]|nr:hypothetical protein [Leptospirales bacterium]
MIIKMIAKYKNIILIAFSCILLLVFGYCLGSKLGREAIGGLYSMRFPVMSLFYTPARQHYETAFLLNSDDELKRIAGYYSILDGGVFDAGYLKERYLKEDSLLAKKTILWALANRGASEVLSSLYELASEDEKALILRALDEIRRNQK